MILGGCCIAIILGIYMTFFHDRNAGADPVKEEDVGTELSSVPGEYDYIGKPLPNIENESADETYAVSEDSGISLENTAVLDQGSIPLEVQVELLSKIQNFLAGSGYGDVTELYLDEGSYEETSDRVTFYCRMTGYRERLYVQYFFSRRQLMFLIAEPK